MLNALRGGSSDLVDSGNEDSPPHPAAPPPAAVLEIRCDPGRAEAVIAKPGRDSRRRTALRASLIRRIQQLARLVIAERRRPAG
jgi:hypothetical protein